MASRVACATYRDKINLRKWLLVVNDVGEGYRRSCESRRGKGWENGEYSRGHTACLYCFVNSSLLYQTAPTPWIPGNNVLLFNHVTYVEFKFHPPAQPRRPHQSPAGRSDPASLCASIEPRSLNSFPIAAEARGTYSETPKRKLHLSP